MFLVFFEVFEELFFFKGKNQKAEDGEAANVIGITAGCIRLNSYKPFESWLDVPSCLIWLEQ